MRDWKDYLRTQEIKVVKIGEIKPFENNPRLNKKAVPAVAASIKRFGFRNPILVDAEGVIIEGHTRRLAALELGMKKVPVVYVTDLTQDEVDALRVIDNKTAELADWDMDKLADEMMRLPDFNFGDFGFDLSTFTDLELATGKTDDDYVPEIEDGQEPMSKRGEVYLLGDHRLMCGDSTSADDVARLMNDAKADLLFTDPPYGVSYEKKTKEVLKSKSYTKIQNDDLTQDQFQNFLYDVFMNAFSWLKDTASYYVFSCQGGDQEIMMMMMREAGIPCRHQIIWVKDAPVFSMGRLDYDYKHEPILYGWIKKHDFQRKGEQDKSVWEYKRTANKLHPTMKPVELIINALLNSTKNNESVLDLFGGSGSTIIACEQSHRKCRAMELDEHYCDVIRKRWAEYVHGEGCDWVSLTPKEN